MKCCCCSAITSPPPPPPRHKRSTGFSCLQTFSPKGPCRLRSLFRAETCTIEAVEPEVGKWGTGSVRFTFGSLTRWLAGAARCERKHQRNDHEGGKDRQKLGRSVSLRCKSLELCRRTEKPKMRVWETRTPGGNEILSPNVTTRTVNLPRSRQIGWKAIDSSYYQRKTTSPPKVQGKNELS